MVDGEFILRDGKFLNLDEDTIIREADSIGKKVWQRLLEKYPNVPFPITLAP